MMIPKLFSQLKRDVLSIVILLIQFSFQFLIDPLVLFTSHEERREFDEGEGSEETQLPRAEEFQERSEHFILYRAQLEDVFGRFLIITGKDK